MKKLLVVAASLLVLAGCGGSDGGSEDGGSPTTATSEPATGDSDAGSGVPDIAFPPGAEVEELAPGFTQYTAVSTTVDAMKTYWEGYFESIGFTKYNEANASVFYEKGTVKMQATYAQFDADVRGTVKVLSQ